METMSLMDVGSFTVEDLAIYREKWQDMTVQLLDGELVVSPSPAYIHQLVVSRLFSLVDRAAPPGLVIIPAPMDLRAGERSVLQPDLMVLDESMRFDGEVLVPPVLAIEVLSPSSQRTDLVRKPEILARFGCKHYWVVDPVRPAIRSLQFVGDMDSIVQTVEDDDLFAAAEPFPVSCRPADLVR